MHFQLRNVQPRSEGRRTTNKWDGSEQQGTVGPAKALVQAKILHQAINNEFWHPLHRNMYRHYGEKKKYYKRDCNGFT